MSLLKLPCIYPIASNPSENKYSHFLMIQKFLKGGAQLVQFRDKIMNDDLVLKLLRPIVQECHKVGTRLVVNDRADIASAVGADGVHLGQTDIEPKTASSILGKQALIVLSTHNMELFDKDCEENSIDYISLCPVFSTTSKLNPDPVLGLENFRQIVKRSPIPVVAIGGISLDRAIELWSAGASSVAVISDLSDHTKTSDRIRHYRKLWETQFEKDLTSISSSSVNLSQLSTNQK